jgi:ribosomal protein S18 acetylase RimI-like enzyme
MKIITIHGIRRQNRFNETLSSLDSVTENSLEIIPFDFGYFKLIKFLWPLTREAVVNEFCQFYSNNFINEEVPPSAIAHSFGTYVVYRAMERHKHIKFSTIILCGSILNSKTDFRTMINNNQFKNLYNDHGKKEWFLKVTRICINRYCGNAGKVGFKDIPRNYQNKVINRGNYFRHSDYFLDINMDKEWIATLLKNKIRFNFKKTILRDEVIERIYKNQENSNYPFKILGVEYFARIDKDRTYFAKSKITVTNENTNLIDSYSFATTADGTNEGDEMNISILDENGNKLYFNWEADVPNLKKIQVLLDKQLKYGETQSLNHYFTWDKTITFKGDTDHWTTKDINSVSLQLNFPYKLTNPRVYKVKSRQIIEELIPNLKIEIDETFTYSYEFTNNSKIDGIIFYFDGHINHSTKNNHNTFKNHIGKRNKHKIVNNKNEVLIERATLNDIEQIYDIEKQVELRNAAEHSVLKSRLNMFNDSIYVVKIKNKIVSYIECLIWNRKPFKTFNEISNFPVHYNVNGNSVYIIFLATHPSHRKKGYAKLLLSKVEEVANKYNAKEICLVAKDDLVDFYKKYGYQGSEELPDFLKGREYKSILMIKNIVK